MSKIINASGVNKSFGALRVVRDVSFGLERGEFLAIKGPSGSGKSTLLGLLAGLEKPDSGSILVADSELADMNEDQLALFRRRSIGFVFQSFNLIPTLNVVENIALPVFPERLARRTMLARAAEAASGVGLGERLQHFPSQLSGGEQQRVAIARALINNPAILLADEPTGNLDSDTGRKIVDLLSRLNGEKELSLVLVTHDDSVAARAGRILYMKDGSLNHED
jgi:putative ABC transport system ATP-binding protein